MKTITRLFVLLILSSSLTFTACQKDDEPKEPQLPPQNSMIMDFEFGSSQKSEPAFVENQVVSYFAVAAVSVRYWSTVAALHTAIPAAAFQKALESKPTWDDVNKVWVWSYSTIVVNDTYEARLTGKVESDSLKWEMYLSKAGSANLQNQLWFEGKSHTGRTGGWWILNYPKTEGTVQMQPALKINWSSTDNNLFSLRYTYVADKVFNLTGNYYENNRAKGSFIEYGKVQDTRFDAYYILNSTETNEQFNIFWNTTTKAGKIEKEGTNESGCWNSNLINTPCE